MTIAFWASVLLIGYAYVGYALLLSFRALQSSRAVRKAKYSGSISVVLVVHNEIAVLDRKVKNLLGLRYPSDRFEIIVVSDGSTDGTNQLLLKYSEHPNLRVICKQKQEGKAAGLNDALEVASGQVVIFTDARQYIEPEAIPILLENLADPTVGAVSGALILGNPESGEAGQGVGLYWRIEKRVRELESTCSSTIGATGAFYAVRRELIVRLSTDLVLDDVYVPMHVLRQGYRVLFEPGARIWDAPDQGIKREFARKVRTLTGIYQLVQLEPWLLSVKNPEWFGFVSHKLSRLLVPFAFIAVLISSAVLQGWVYRTALIIQLAFYALGIWALIGRKGGVFGRAANAAFTLVLLNTAALVAFGNFVGQRRVDWAH